MQAARLDNKKHRRKYRPERNHRMHYAQMQINEASSILPKFD